jgi:hypothetical protein
MRRCGRTAAHAIRSSDICVLGLRCSRTGSSPCEFAHGLVVVLGGVIAFLGGPRRDPVERVAGT